MTRTQEQGLLALVSRVTRRYFLPDRGPVRGRHAAQLVLALVGSLSLAAMEARGWAHCSC